MEINKQNLNKLKDRGSFIGAVITFTVIFIIVEFFAFGMLSLKEYSSMRENSNQIIVYMKDLDEEKKEEFSRKILNIEGITSIRYESKEVALRAAILELGVAVDENSNPLEDAFFVYVNRKANLEKLRDSFSKMNEISAVDFRTTAIQSSFNFANGIDNLAVQVTSMFSLVILLMVYIIISINVKSRKKEINEFLNEGIEARILKRVFFFENVEIIVGSAVLSFIIYQLSKRWLLTSIKLIAPEFISNVFLGNEFMVVLLLTFTSIFLSAIIAFFGMNKHFKITKKEEVNKDKDEDIKDLEDIDGLEDIENIEGIGEYDENYME